MKFLIDFLGNILEYLKIQSEELIGKEDAKYPESDNPKDAYKWLLDELKGGKSTRAQENRDPWLKPGKIYIFKYDAKYKDVLEYWDMHPIVLALGKMQTENSIVNVGLNLSWYPPDFRKKIIEKIVKIYGPKYQDAMNKHPRSANMQDPVYLDLYQLKLALDPMGLSWAIRSYLPEKIKNPKICICYEDWDKAIRLDQPKIYPELKGSVSLYEILQRFKKYVLNYNSNRAFYRKKTEEAKKLNKYRFIK